MYSISNSLLETFIEQSIGQLLIKIIVVIQKKRKRNGRGRRNEVSNDFYKYLDHRESVKSAQKLASLFILVVLPSAIVSAKRGKGKRGEGKKRRV